MSNHEAAERRFAKLERRRKQVRRRRERNAEAYLGHVSDIDPTRGMAQKQPPTLGTVARIIGEIG